jgi:hypothetical protein
MGIPITFIFGIRMGVGMGMVFIYNQLLISDSRCDGHSNTLTIFKAKESEFIFGGYTMVDWESCPKPGKYKSDQNAFLFSLTNRDNKPIKIKIHPNFHEYAICCRSSFGPIFGGDIFIANNSNTTMESISDLGLVYKHPQYAFETDEAKTFFLENLSFFWTKLKSMKKNELIKRIFFLKFFVWNKNTHTTS